MKVIRPSEPASFDRLADFMEAKQLGIVHELDAVGNPIEKRSPNTAPERTSRFFRASELHGKAVPAREWLVPTSSRTGR